MTSEVSLGAWGFGTASLKPRALSVRALIKYVKFTLIFLFNKENYKLKKLTELFLFGILVPIVNIWLDLSS